MVIVSNQFTQVHTIKHHLYVSYISGVSICVLVYQEACFGCVHITQFFVVHAYYVPTSSQFTYTAYGIGEPVKSNVGLHKNWSSFSFVYLNF